MKLPVTFHAGLSVINKRAIVTALSLLVLSVSPLSGNSPLGLFKNAHAEETGHSGGHSGGKGGSSSHGGGHTDGGHEEGEEGHEGGKGKGKGGSGHTDGSHGGHSGGSVEGKVLRGGGKPWSREGIPEVELGRLNVARSPAHVLARAEHEALSRYTATMAELYNMSAESAAALLQAKYGETARIDSPLQNLALYKDLMTFGKTQLPGVTPKSQLDLAAIFLGSASDKSIPVSENTVIAINAILGLVPLKAEDVKLLATKAEAVRAAILAGHGER